MTVALLRLRLLNQADAAVLHMVAFFSSFASRWSAAILSQLSAALSSPASRVLSPLLSPSVALYVLHLLLRQLFLGFFLRPHSVTSRFFYIIFLLLVILP